MIGRVIYSLKNQGWLLVVDFSNTIGSFQFNLTLRSGQWELSINSINSEIKVLLKTWVSADFRLLSHSGSLLGKVSTTSFLQEEVTAMVTHKIAYNSCHITFLPGFMNDCIFKSCSILLETILGWETFSGFEDLCHVHT